MQSMTRSLVAATALTVFLGGCGKSPTPPRVYTTPAKGAATAQQLIDNFKKAHTARDTDAAMKLFYWKSADNQDVLWLSINTLFEAPADSVEQIPPEKEGESAGSPPKTAIPVVSRLRITTKTTSTGHSAQVLMIGENENGFYFVPPLNE